MSIPLTREPARIYEQGTFPLPGFDRTVFTIGRDEVAEATPHIMRDAPGVLAVDIEGCGKDGRKRYDVKAVIIGTSTHSHIFDPRDPYQFKLVHEILNSGDYLLAFHNSPFDIPILFMIGLIELETIWRVIDTLIWARLAEPDERASKDLRNAANRHLGLNLTNPLPGMCKALGISMDVWYQTKDLDSPAYRIMAASDVILTHRLVSAAKTAAYNRLTTGHPFSTYGITGDEALTLVMREQILNRQHLRRTCKGFLVDPEYLDRYRQTTAVRIRDAESVLAEHEIRPGNTGDLTSWLEVQGLLPDDYPRTTKTHKPSGKKSDLALLQHDLARTFVEHKEITHIDRDYLAKVMDNSDESGRVHPAVGLLTAATGRMAISGDAPLHQFPPDARGIILADDWEQVQATMNHPVMDDNGDSVPCTCKTPKGLVSIDWSQIEPVVVANIAGDTHAVEAYEKGDKFYDVIAHFAGISYKAAKITLLAQLYGEGVTKLARDLNVSIEDAGKIRDLVWKTLPGSRRLAGKKGKLQTIANEHRLIFTLSGRIVPIPSGRWPCWNDHDSQDSIDACWKCDSDGTIFSIAVHKGVNYFVQGSAYDLLAEAEIKIIEAGLGDAIYLPMHDELVVQAEAAHDIRRIMETPPERLIQLAKRTPKLRTDMAHLGIRWAAV